MKHPGRFWAYVGTIFGVSVSAAANFAETVANPSVPESASKGAALLMALLPVGLFVALEVLVRNRIKEHLWWWRGGMLITALAFAIPSYSHMHDLLADWGQNGATCVVTPFGFDGLMLLSTLALLLDPSKASSEGDGRPPSRYDYIVAIPPAPVITRTIVLPQSEPIVIEKRAEPIPTDTVTMKPRKPRSGPLKRYNRPEDNPLFGQWQREDWTDEELAARSGKTVGAARAQAGRWRTYLSTRGPEVSRDQIEMEMSQK